MRFIRATESLPREDERLAVAVEDDRLRASVSTVALATLDLAARRGRRP
jgi:hypothetical protein